MYGIFMNSCTSNCMIALGCEEFVKAPRIIVQIGVVTCGRS